MRNYLWSGNNLVVKFDTFPHFFHFPAFPSSCYFGTRASVLTWPTVHVWISLDYLWLTVSNIIISPSLFFSVQGIVIGSQLWYLPWRPVHRHWLRGQEGHSLRSHLLNSDWMKKSQTNNEGAGPRLPPAPMTVQSVGGMENMRHSSRTLLFCLRLWKKQEKEKPGGTKSDLWIKKETCNFLNTLRTLVSL